MLQRILLVIVALVLATLAAVVLINRANAQDDTSHYWITKNPKYVRADNVHCCGPDHCKRQKADFVREVSRGWYVKSTEQMFTEETKGLYYSEDNEVWACINAATQKVDCLFVNPGGAKLWSPPSSTLSAAITQ